LGPFVTYGQNTVLWIQPQRLEGVTNI
jgi:hypothetical protein